MPLFCRASWPTHDFFSFFFFALVLRHLFLCALYFSLQISLLSPSLSEQLTSSKVAKPELQATRDSVWDSDSAVVLQDDFQGIFLLLLIMTPFSPWQILHYCLTALLIDLLIALEIALCIQCKWSCAQQLGYRLPPTKRSADRGRKTVKIRCGKCFLFIFFSPSNKKNPSVWHFLFRDKIPGNNVAGNPLVSKVKLNLAQN